MRKTRVLPISKPAPAKQTHQAIVEQTLHYLNSGGEIVEYPLGATGQKGISTIEFTINSVRKPRMRH